MSGTKKVAKMALEQRIAILAAGLGMTLACSAPVKEQRLEVFLGDVGLLQGVTDENGKVSFPDLHEAGKRADFFVDDKDTGKRLDSDKVLYIDGPDFKMVLHDHPDYEPRLEIFRHNSEHYHSLTKAPLQFLYHSSEDNERNAEATAKAFSFLQSIGQKTGCYPQSQVYNAARPGAYIVKRGLSYLTVGVSDLYEEDFAAYLANEMPADSVLEVYSIIPSKYGFYALTTLMTMEMRAGTCDTETSEETPPAASSCDGAVFCDEFTDSLDQWYVKGNATTSDGWARLQGGASILAKPSFSCADATVEYTAHVQGSYGLFLGNRIALYADQVNNTLDYVCASEGNRVNKIGTDVQVRLQEGNLHLILDGEMTEKIPCYSQLNMLNVSAGSISEVQLDRMELRCD